MAGTDFDFELIRGEVALYQAQAEAWKPAHQSAMRCRALERRLALGVLIFQQITQVDEDWRKQVFAGSLPFSELTETAIRETYRTWQKACAPFSQAIDDLEADEYEVEHAGEFRHCCREVNGMLMDDKNYFSSAQLTALRDESIDAHRGGATEEISDFDE